MLSTCKNETEQIQVGEEVGSNWDEQREEKLYSDIKRKMKPIEKADSPMPASPVQTEQKQVAACACLGSTLTGKPNSLMK